jgi:uncharacterized protein YkwD
MIPALHGNWVDLLIIVIVIFFIYQGFLHGFWSILIDFVAFFGALLISLKTYKLGSSFLQSNFSLNYALSNALGYLFMAVTAEILISFIVTFLIKKIPQKILKNRFTKVMGIFLSLGQGLILIAFVITFAISLPISPAIKTDISNSKIGGFILSKTAGIEIGIPLTYTTIEPESKSINIDSGILNLKVDETAENQMFKFINNERITRNIPALNWSTQLLGIARNYAKLMWTEHYFGHYDKNGNDVGDRLRDANIFYTVAGENLALAPTVQIANTGLMNSPGHKANILDKEFKKVGIGVIDNGYYGKMFVQVFTD